MGELLRRRLLRALGLSGLGAQLNALSARLRRLEQDVATLQRGQRPITIPASPPPPYKPSGDA